MSHPFTLKGLALTPSWTALLALLMILMMSAIAWAHSNTFGVKIVNNTGTAVGVTCNGESIVVGPKATRTLTLQRKFSPLKVHCHAIVHSHGDEENKKITFEKTMEDGETETFAISD